MRILVIGSGGREHALVWKIRQSPLVSKIWCAPGNAGIEESAECLPLVPTDIDSLVRFARSERIDLTVVGPEQPLTAGIADRFRTEGLQVFGPSKSAAVIEGSKVFAKEFMRRHNIPTAEFRSFEYEGRYDAERFVNQTPVPIVIKADGLAGGKGVTICESKDRALEVIDSLMGKRIFGESGSRIVIEEFLEGEEASVFAVTDGKNFVTLPPARDFKRVFDHDQGKNTGGMGAIAPAVTVTDEILEEVRRTIIRPTLDGLASEGRPFAGCLYVGLMLTPTGPKVIEYNCRLGDPETQVVLPLIESDLVPLLVDAAEGRLSPQALEVGDRTAVCVVIASSGYPDSYETGKPIFGLDAIGRDQDVLLFHAATKRQKDTVVSAGGRVLGVTAVGPRQSLEQTVSRAYRAVEKITFDGAYYRSDIGRAAVERISQSQREGLP